MNHQHPVLQAVAHTGARQHLGDGVPHFQATAHGGAALAVDVGRVEQHLDIGLLAQGLDRRGESLRRNVERQSLRVADAGGHQAEGQGAEVER
ncbi:hypothetical protein D3C76_609740 [compost metagenome]